MKYYINEESLTSLANKIREKLGVTDTILPSAMPGKIGEISAGEGVYAWKKSDVSGSFIEYILDNDEAAYPKNGAHTDGFVYEIMKYPIIIEFQIGENMDYLHAEKGMT